MRLFLLQQKIIIYQKRQMEKNVRKGEIKSNVYNRINAEEYDILVNLKKGVWTLVQNI